MAASVDVHFTPKLVIVRMWYRSVSVWHGPSRARRTSGTCGLNLQMLDIIYAPTNAWGCDHRGHVLITAKVGSPKNDQTCILFQGFRHPRSSKSANLFMQVASCRWLPNKVPALVERIVRYDRSQRPRIISNPFNQTRVLQCTSRFISG